MGATKGYFILLCALNLAVKGNDGSITNDTVTPVTAFHAVTDSMTAVKGNDGSITNDTVTPVTAFHAVTDSMTVSSRSRASDGVTSPAGIHIQSPRTTKRTDTAPSHGDSVTTAHTLSKPEIWYNLTLNKTTGIRCFSKSGDLPITYSIVRDLTSPPYSSHTVTLHTRQPADFHIDMTQGNVAVHRCKAVSGSLTMYSDPLPPIKIHKEDEATTYKVSESEDDILGPRHLIILSHILTSVNRDVQYRNTIVMAVCGPIILFVLAMFIVLNHFNQRRDCRDKP
ncbi:uncharacterized protein LOC134610475 [Pelobates fuscus]|uniref:uncharacterized protein LOC134610475 n=1 Tax=Pelobates fuscus TaxID=191477 RepID=UPI002FE48AA6